jgi:4-amino-4-deoxy-L-arabinose transferase-like glycosyltransferase
MRALDLRLQSTPWFLIAALCGALLIRLIVVSIVFHSVAANTLDHNEFGWEMGWTARSIALHQGFSSPFLPVTGPTALVPPLYPFLLAAIFRIFGLYTATAAVVTLSLNSLFSALTCIPIYFGLRHAANRRLARLATIGWAIYPFSVYFAADRVWDYALTALLFSCCFWAAQKVHLRSTWSWLILGLLFGLTTLSNPSVLSVLPFLLLLSLYKVQCVDGPWLRNGLITLSALAMLCGPWVIRNHRVLHTSSTLRSGFWLEFWAGNNGDTSDSNPAWAHPASNPAELQQYRAFGEVAYMARKRSLSLSFVRHRPSFFITATLRRVVRFWTGFWSFSRAYLQREPLDIPNLFFCTALTLFMVRGARRWWKDNPAAAFPYLLTLVLFPLPYYLTHSSMDYRQPIEPLVVALVTMGIFGMANESERDSSRSRKRALRSKIALETEPVLPVVAMEWTPAPNL